MLGIGLGGTPSKMMGIVDNKLEDMGLDTHTSFVLSTQLGGITMFNQYFGLEYYYNLDVMFDDSLKNKDKRTTITNGYGSITQNSHYDVFGVIATSTLNANAVMNVYWSKNFVAGFVAGLGLGFDIASYKGNIEHRVENIGIIWRLPFDIDSFGVSFDMRANLGLRFVFQGSYGLSFDVGIPFFANAVDSVTAIKDDVNFSVRFTYYLF